MTFRTPAKVPQAPAMLRITPLDVTLVLLFKFSVLIVGLGVLGGGTWIGYKYYAFRSSEYGKIREREVADAQSELQIIEAAYQRGKSVIMQANLRLANGMILTRLFRPPYPSDNTYQLEKFSIVASADVVSSFNKAVGDAETKEKAKLSLVYRCSTAWTATTAAVIDTVRAITQSMVLGMRADFESPVMASWSSRFTPEAKRNQNTTGQDVYAIEVRGELNAPKQPIGSMIRSQGGSRTVMKDSPELEQRRFEELRKFRSR